MILLIGGGVSLLVFFVLFWFFSNTNRTIREEDAAAMHASAMHGKAFTISSKDIETIAGDDVLTTQLDLARAYIETDRKALAKNILSNVISQGSPDQKIEARQLMETNF